MTSSSETSRLSGRPAWAFDRRIFLNGMRDGVPIALGYFAVSFSLGIAARNAGLTPLQGFFASLLNNASAGEYAAFTLIAANATLFQVALITLIANARYLLMSCALAQRFAPGTPFFHRLIIAYDVTDELFGITISRPGCLNPFYTYGAILLAAPAWAFGTAFGIMAGNALPLRAVSALSVALYGMFLAIIIPRHQLCIELFRQLCARNFCIVRRNPHDFAYRADFRCRSNFIPGQKYTGGIRT